MFIKQGSSATFNRTINVDISGGSLSDTSTTANVSYYIEFEYSSIGVKGANVGLLKDIYVFVDDINGNQQKITVLKDKIKINTYKGSVIYVDSLELHLGPNNEVDYNNSGLDVFNAFSR